MHIAKSDLPLKPTLEGAGGGGVGCVFSLANYSIAFEETQSNRVSDFRDILCSLFPTAMHFDFYLYL